MTRAPLTGRQFWKMTGSGNDFVFFDNRDGRHDDLVDPQRIAALCDRRLGVGADGIVLIDRSERGHFGMRYYNRDGSLAEMCGNAALCTARLASTLGFLAAHGDTHFDTPSGPVVARMVGDTPEIDLVAVTGLQTDAAIALAPGEMRMGYAHVGVPHLVILCENADTVDVVGRGRPLRHHPSLPDGANVNFVSHISPGRWRMRTYERGVEDETLACGSGSVAASTLLHTWGLALAGVTLATSSGCDVFARGPESGRAPVLRGEGRIVFSGTLHTLLVD